MSNHEIARRIRKLVLLIEIGNHAPGNDYRLVEAREAAEELSRREA